MNNRLTRRFATAIAILSLGLATRAMAQSPSIPFHVESFIFDSGIHTNASTEFMVAYSGAVTAPGSAWLQLHVDDVALPGGSYLVLTGLSGAVQYLDAKSLFDWRNNSALFNGDIVTVDLVVAPGAAGAFVRMSQVTAGEWVGGGGGPESLCADDDRVVSIEPRVGRITPVGCTGWITANGALLTAGHCMGATMTTLQFNVPQSNADGTINNPPPQDQYPITTVVGFDDGNGAEGNDWSVFNCGPNSNTGLFPIQAQGNVFFRMSRDDTPGSVRVTGFGTDNTPPGSMGGFNGQNQTNQTDWGAYVGETTTGPSDITIEYMVDTEGGNSGSPVIIFGTTMTIGIHTNAGCDPPNGNGNAGTSFEHDALENAIAAFPGANARYVDVGHAVATRDGTVFRPFATVAAGVSSVPTGGIVSIVAGDYTEAAGNAITVSRAMVLRAPVGTVVIGN